MAGESSAGPWSTWGSSPAVQHSCSALQRLFLALSPSPTGLRNIKLTWWPSALQFCNDALRRSLYTSCFSGISVLELFTVKDLTQNKGSPPTCPRSLCLGSNRFGSHLGKARLKAAVVTAGLHGQSSVPPAARRASQAGEAVGGADSTRGHADHPPTRHPCATGSMGQPCPQRPEARPCLTAHPSGSHGTWHFSVFHATEILAPLSQQGPSLLKAI